MAFVDPSSPPSPLPAGLACIRCGYDLTGLLPDGRCPECGGAIARSLHGDLLRFASVPYLLRLRRAVITALVATISLYNLPAIMAIALMATDNESLMRSVGVVGAFACLLTLSIAWWALTTPDPDRLRDDGSARSRRLARWGYLAAAGLASAALLVSNAAQPGRAVFWDRILLATVVGAYVCAVGAYLACLIYVRALARRAQDSRLRGWAVIGLVHTILWALCVAVYFLCMWTGLGLRVFGFPAVNRVASVTYIGAALLTLLYLITLPLTFDRLRAALARCTSEARAHARGEVANAG